MFRTLLIVVTTYIGVVSCGSPCPVPPSGQIYVETLIGCNVTSPPLTTSYIEPGQRVTPYYMWLGNSGYCGEVGQIQGGLQYGTFVNQYYTRELCGTGLNQGGSNCNYNAQLLLERPNTGVTGTALFASGTTCASNVLLEASSYPYTTGWKTPNVGITGFQDYMSWIKQQVINGYYVNIGVLDQGARDAQYDHEVMVIKIGTNHDVTDATYYPDDVLYFDDHGLYTIEDTQGGGNPSIPLGAAGNDQCTPYVYGYAFDALPHTRAQANVQGAPAYSIIIPDNVDVVTEAGSTAAGGGGKVTIKGPHNYALAYTGVVSTHAEYLLPIQLSIDTATSTNGVANPLDPIAGWQYENPGIKSKGRGCTDTPPATWMNMTFTATIRELIPGESYNLYIYIISNITPSSTLDQFVPTADFNANAAMATQAVSFLAPNEVYQYTIQASSGQIVVCRCVPDDAP